MSKSSPKYIKNAGLKDILRGISDLETPVLESFYKEISDLIARRKTKVLSKKESELFLIINKSPFNSKQRNRYTLLYGKLQEEEISQEEKEELSLLIKLQEKQGIVRLKALIELAGLRQVSLDELMKDLGIPNITPNVASQTNA